MRRDDGIPTRASLLERLKDMGDQASWDAFYEIYHELIFSVARRAGLTESEAREVVQDTLIAVARKMPGFTYDPAKDSFKGWLLTVVRWRILDQLSRRDVQAGQQHQRSSSGRQMEQDTRTATIDRVPDPGVPGTGVGNTIASGGVGAHQTPGAAAALSDLPPPRRPWATGAGSGPRLACERRPNLSGQAPRR
jgi:RNA polymerase sigma factor (sigma-70 family)